MAKWDHKGSVDFYQKRPESNWWVWVVGGIVVLAALGQCSGG